MVFENRQDAGRRLADRLKVYSEKDCIVYGLPRGGVVTAAEVARILKAPLDAIITRKVGHPQNPGFAVCAVSESGQPICGPAATELEQSWLNREIEIERAEAARRRQAYPSPNLAVAGRIAIVVDDGIATGLTMLAAVAELKTRRPGSIVVAAPVIPADTLNTLQEASSEVVAVEVPEVFLGAVGAYFKDFEQTKDGEVINLLQESMKNA